MNTLRAALADPVTTPDLYHYEGDPNEPLDEDGPEPPWPDPVWVDCEDADELPSVAELPRGEHWKPSAFQGEHER